jgi:hypothetical protein
MKKLAAIMLVVGLVMCCAVAGVQAQNKWVVGGNMGLSLFEGTAGFHVGPMAEFALNRNLAVGSEFTINTQGGTQAIWFSYVKYHFPISGSKLRPYGDAGFLLDFATGGPYFGFLGGGGVNIPMANRLSISPEIQLGPIFSVGGGTYGYGGYSYTVKGTTIFAVIIRGGIRYEI